MQSGRNPPDKFDSLRQEAEKRIRGSEPKDVPLPGDVMELIHELRIHQAELEIQNEELKRAQQALSDLYRQYERLYEFAPCGYVTLNPHGIITRVNLTAVVLLRRPKKKLLEQVFSKYIARGWQDAFLEARHNAARSGENQRLELQLIRNSGPLLLRYTRQGISLIYLYVNSAILPL